jgi:hypothetical protein
VPGASAPSAITASLYSFTAESSNFTHNNRRRTKEEGWELYCWSSGGGDYAKASAEELGIAACFAGFLPKPDVMIDDVPPQSWSFLRVVHPAEIKQNNFRFEVRH